ncbi:MAG: metallophosphoesterase [Myxococcales bacterium]|nr:metallophosphoesterase [Myxococcales bacterium]
MPRSTLAAGLASTPALAPALALALLSGCPGDDPPATDSSSSTTGEDSTGSSTADDTSTTDADGTGTSTTGELPDPLPPLGAVPTTVDQRIEPTHAVEAQPLDPRIPDEREQLLEQGFGDHALGPGEPVEALTPDGSPPPDPGPSPQLLTRFVHLADTQVADDESPLRYVEVDSAFISGAFRPQEAYGCQITNAAVRTINAVHARTPLRFVVLGGDNADSAQTNEVQWFLDILDGAPVVHCDSGSDDDPLPGEGNDPKDPFAPVGLDVPWIWVSGNHDVLVQGNFSIEGREEDAVGSNVPGGSSTLDWSQPGAPVFDGPVVPDPARALLDPVALMSLVLDSGDGHGITEDALAAGRTTYAWDVPDSALRLVVVDSTALTGDASGLVTDTDVEQHIRPLLDQAEADGKLVMVATHHASTSLGDGAGIGGPPQPGALEPADWQALLGEYPNVIAHLAGHSHVHRATYIEPAPGSGYWEIITAAIADWPHQMRIVEVHDQDNGWLTITGIALDYATDGDGLAADGRIRGVLDFTSGWTPDGSGTPQDRNVQLWVPAP